MPQLRGKQQRHRQTDIYTSFVMIRMGSLSGGVLCLTCDQEGNGMHVAMLVMISIYLRPSLPRLAATRAGVCLLPCMSASHYIGGRILLFRQAAVRSIFAHPPTCFTTEYIFSDSPNSSQDAATVPEWTGFTIIPVRRAWPIKPGLLIYHRVWFVLRVPLHVSFYPAALSMSPA